MIEKELKIREVSGDYALDIPFADGSVNTNIIHVAYGNARTLKKVCTSAFTAVSIAGFASP